MMEYIQSTRGCWKILHRGYMYVKKRELVKNNTLVYECAKRRITGKCKAKIKVCENKVINTSIKHTYLGLKQYKKVMSSGRKIKKNSINTQETLQQIASQAVEHTVSRDTILQLPPMSGIRCYKKAVDAGRCTRSATPINIVIPYECKTSDGLYHQGEHVVPQTFSTVPLLSPTGEENDASTVDDYNAFECVEGDESDKAESFEKSCSSSALPEWTPFPVKIINEVKKHQFLFDSTHRDYTNHPKKEQTWLKITEAVGCPPSSVMMVISRWRTLRSTYTRNLNRVLERRTKGWKPNWKLYGHMTFMEKHVTRKPELRMEPNDVTCKHPGKDDDLMECGTSGSNFDPSSGNHRDQEGVHPFADVDDSVSEDDSVVKDEVIIEDEDSLDQDQEYEDPIDRDEGHKQDEWFSLGEESLYEHQKISSSPPEDLLIFHEQTSSTKESIVQDPKGKSFPQRSTSPVLRPFFDQVPKLADVSSESRFVPVSGFQQQEPIIFDEAELYGRYVDVALRKMSVRSMSLAKLRIQQILNDLLEEDSQSQT